MSLQFPTTELDDPAADEADECNPRLHPPSQIHFL
jgi:hypothetical protein